MQDNVFKLRPIASLMSQLAAERSQKRLVTVSKPSTSTPGRKPHRPRLITRTMLERPQRVFSQKKAWDKPHRNAVSDETTHAIATPA